jgi:hypothetical protein
MFIENKAVEKLRPQPGSDPGSHKFISTNIWAISFGSFFENREAKSPVSYYL